MNIWLLRHGRTKYNDERRYQGQLDVPLSLEGEAELITADFSPELVYVSPLRRSQQTARIIFPQARQIVMPDFAEMDFGAFDGRTADEMREDADYRAWVDGGCIAPCPGGESRAEFCKRTCTAFEEIVKIWQGESLVIVAHGGTVRALMEQFALPQKDYYDWTTGNASGYLLNFDEILWREQRKLRFAENLCFVRGVETC